MQLHRNTGVTGSENNMVDYGHYNMLFLRGGKYTLSDPHKLILYVLNAS